MRFMTAVHTDVGLVKKVNQDSLLVLQADTEDGPILLAVICDGMGGLSSGEIASACVITGFSDWFKLELPFMLRKGFQREALKDSWDSLIREANYRIKTYGKNHQVTMGTTCAALLLFQGVYYLLNVGDSRVYLIDENVFQLTKDHTYIQQELDANRMTYEQSLVDPKRNALTQCIGAGANPVPDYFFGDVQPDQSFLLCCDGFRYAKNSSGQKTRRSLQK